MIVYSVPHFSLGTALILYTDIKSLVILPIFTYALHMNFAFSNPLQSQTQKDLAEKSKDDAFMMAHNQIKLKMIEDQRLS